MVNSTGEMMSRWKAWDIVKYVGHSLQFGGKFKSWVFIKVVTNDDGTVSNIEQVLGEYTYDFNQWSMWCDTVDEIPVIIE